MGTAVRLTALAARFTVGGAKTAKVINKADKAQTAFKAMLEDFEKCSDILKQLGEKLVQARSANRFAVGFTKSTVVLKKKMIKRESGCMNCKSKDHSTPREFNGCVVYE
jgi:predicted Zn-ribbon and HTH transcriptional regulator